MSYSFYLPRIVQQEIQHWCFFRGEIRSKTQEAESGRPKRAIIFTPDQLDFLETLKGSSKRQGEQLLRYNPQKHPLGAAPVVSTSTAPLDQVGRAASPINFKEWNK